MGSRGKKKKELRATLLPGWNQTVAEVENARARFDLAKDSADAEAIRIAQTVKGIQNNMRMIRESGSFSEVRENQDAAFRRSVEARMETARLIEQSKALQERMAEEFEKGRQAGFKQAGWPIIKCCMAGACLMLSEAFGMDEDEIVRGLNVLHEKIALALTYSELAEDVLDKTGIELQLDDPLEPIRHK